MSCQIRLTATVSYIPAIRRCLFPTDDSRGSDVWLQSCEISVSPTGDLIALIKERRLVILSSKWNPDTSTNQFTIAYAGSVHESDNVKAVLCVPVVLEGKKSGEVDFTCILLGFESGFVRFYTQDCHLLLEEQLHNEVISGLKCQSQHNPNPKLCPDLHPENIFIHYQSNVCVISGQYLFPILRNRRSELAKLQAKGESNLEPMEQLNLNVQKWGFSEQAIINDIAIVGANLHCTFDHLLTVSTCGGFDSKYMSSTPLNNLVLAVGSRPFLGYHYALQGCPQPVLTDVAKAVANKLKSTLSGWLTPNKSPPEKQLPTSLQKPIDTMGYRFGLTDLRRCGQKIILSWNHKLAAISDSLGRVLLIDAYRGIILHIFKGYRDAQCAFLQLPDEQLTKHEKSEKVAMFFVIYSPKRGTIEIFTSQTCVKIATFSAAKFSRLIYISYGLMGFSQRCNSKFICHFQTIFIDNNGDIKEILVPFHFSLPETNSQRSRDIHLFKKIKNYLKIGQFTEEIPKICTELQTDELRKETINLLLSKNCPFDLLIKCFEFFAKHFDCESELGILTENVCRLLHFFTFIILLENEEDDKFDFESNLTQLHNLQKLISLLNKPSEIKVTFSENLKSVQLLQIFDLTNTKIGLKESDYQVAEFLFEKYVNNIAKNYTNLEKQLLNCRIRTESLFELLIEYWVNRPLISDNLEVEMTNLHKLLKIFVKTADPDLFFLNHANVSIFWSKIREILMCSCPFPALIMAILCKCITRQMEHYDDENFEFLSKENIEWSLLIAKLEDVALVDLILKHKPISHDCCLPKINAELPVITLNLVLVKGCGSVSELVAKWLLNSGIDPENLIVNDKYLKEQEESEEEEDDNDDIVPKQDLEPRRVDIVRTESVFHHLNLMKLQFSYSLEAGVLLANMAWEYGLNWQKTQDLTMLKACILCLNYVTDCYTKVGLFYLIWNSFLKSLFENCCKLVNKVGKLPKERLCMQTGLTDRQIVGFFELTTSFLDKYLTADQNCEGKTKPNLYFEQIWEDYSQAFVELCVQQNTINYNLVRLHYQMSLIMELQTKFQVKYTKPLQNLFEPYLSNFFFMDFQSEALIDLSYNDCKINTNRLDFIQKAITASAETLHLNEDGKLYKDEHVNCMETSIKLAHLCKIDISELKRSQCIEVFRNGFDDFGIRLVTGLYRSEKILVGPDLLAIAGRRMKLYFGTTDKYVKSVGSFLPSVTRYINSLPEQWCSPSNIENIERLVRLSLNCLYRSERHEENMAVMFLDGIETLKINIAY